MSIERYDVIIIGSGAGGGTLAYRLAPGGVRLDALDIGAGQQSDIGMTQSRCDADDMRVGLGLNETGKAVAGRASDARTVMRVLLVEHDADRQRERPMSGAREIVGELLDARLVRHRRMRVGLVARRLGRIAAALAMHVIELLCFGVVGREVAV